MSRRQAKRKTDTIIDYSNHASAAAAAEPDMMPSAKQARMSSSNRHKRLSLLDDYGSASNAQGKSEKTLSQYSFFDKQREKKASDAAVTKFEAKIGRQTDKMRQIVADEEKKIEQKRKDFISAFENLFAACNPGILTIFPKVLNDNDRPHRAQHILFEEAEVVTQGSRELLARFEKTDEMVTSHNLALPLQAWTQDKRDFAEIMMCGQEHGQHVIEGLLAPGLYEEPLARSWDQNENQEIAVGLLKKSKKALNEENWGVVFEDQLRYGVSLANSISAEV
ncbi:hypothetical protein Micbo1qcDRAFT_191510 [Microdochium bolleyi]|uniref:Uncharacterized protein n=1 Tax=Microdochium bolleyi TaxID=196109 RepID=A0A136JID2_9PEZI|nr:hypothetical protein Micbo1qcDRAFT_191510 [Microdochium bolleyi]